MAKAIGSLTFQMKVDDSKFTPTLNTMKQEVRNFNQTMKANVSAAKEAGDSLGTYEAKISGLTKMVEKQRNIQKSLEDSLKATGERTKDNGLKWDKAASELEKATATTRNFENQLASTQTKFDRFKTGIDALNKTIELDRKHMIALADTYKSEGNAIDAAKAKITGLTRENNNLNTVRNKEAKVLVDIEKKYGSASDEYTKQATVLEDLTHRMNNNNKAIEKNNKFINSNADALTKMRANYKAASDANRTYVERLDAEGKHSQANIAKAANYRASLRSLSDQYKLQVQDLNRMSSASDTSVNDLNKQKKTVNDIATSYAKMRTQLTLTQKEVDRANPFGISKYASAANSAYRGSVKMSEGFGNAFSKIKDKAMSASLGIIGIGAAAVKGASMASTLQNEYVKTLNLATTGGEKAAEAQKNVNQMQKDGAKYSIEYGKSQASIAEGYQELIKRGYTSAEALGAMKSELQASVASGDDFNNVLSVTSQVIDAYGLRTDNAAKMTKNTKDVVNQLAYAADMTATDFQSLGKGMEYVGDSAHNAGFALSEASSAMGILSNHGLEADKAGTGLRKVINSITGALSDQEDAQKGQASSLDSLNAKIAEHQQKIADYQAAEKAGTKSSKAAASAIKNQQEAIEKLQGKIQGMKSGGTNDMLTKLGINRSQLVDAKGNLKSLTDIMQVVNDKTKNMGTAEKNSVFNALFGTTGQQAGIILAQNNKELDELNKKVKNAADGQGYVANLAKKNMATVKQQMAQFTEAGNAALIMIGKQMLPVISEAAVKMTKAFNSKEGQDGLKKIADGVAWIAGKLVEGVEYIGKHSDQVKIFAATIAGIFAVKKIGDFVGALRVLNDTLKVTQALSIFSGGGGGLSKTVGKQALKSTVVDTAESVGTQTIASRVAGGSLSRVAAGGAVNVAESAAGEAGLLAKLIPVAAKAIPVAGIVAGLLPAVGSIYKATQTSTNQSQNVGKGVGGIGGAAIGGLIGSVGGPVGIALGAAIGGGLGTKLGKAAGDAYQKGFKESHPYSLSAWLGTKWEDPFKKPSSDMKKFSKDYTSQIDKLNRTAKLKITPDAKSIADAKKQTDSTYSAMLKSINNFYAKKQKTSKKDLDVLVKNGQLTQKEEDKILSDSKKSDDKKQKNQQATVNSMKKRTQQYYDDVKKINNGSNKTLEAIALKHGTNSKEYKKELNKQLKKLQDQYTTDMAKSETKLTDQISKQTKISSKKQQDILYDLTHAKKKLSEEQVHNAVANGNKEMNETIKSAKKTRDGAVDAANDKYKQSVAAADKEYYQNGSISRKQHDEIVKNARSQRDKAIDAAETQKNKTTKNAQETQDKIVSTAEKQGKLHKGALDKETGYVIGSYNDQNQGTADVLNDIIGGINGFLNALHKGWGGIPKIKYSYHNYKGYATGTKGLPSNETALVGEEGFELAHTPGQGIYAVGANGPEIRNLQAGTSILPHDMSKQFLAMINKLPAHKNGVTGIISDSFNWLKDKIGDLGSFVSKGAGSAFNFFADKFGFNNIGSGGAAMQSMQKGMGDSAKDAIVNEMKKIFKKYDDEQGDAGGGKGAPSGSGVQRWKSQVKDALKANGLSTSESMVNKVLRQIATESGGNEKAVQGGYTDVNTLSGDLAKGLMQTISATFNAHAFPGHKNIFNGYDNLLAALSYAKARYGANLSYLGEGHGYANGGIATAPSIFGEAGPEMAVPLDKLKRSRAVQLTKELNNRFASDMDNPKGDSTKELSNTISDLTDKLSSNTDGLSSDVSKQLEQTNALLMGVGQLLQSILGESEKANQPLSNNAMNSMSKNMFNRYARTIN